MARPGWIPMSGAGAGPPAAVVVSATIGTGGDAAGGVRCCDRGSGGGTSLPGALADLSAPPGRAAPFRVCGLELLSGPVLPSWCRAGQGPGGVTGSRVARQVEGRSWRRSWCMPEPTGRILRLKLALRATGSDLAPRQSRPARRPRVAPAQATDWHSSGHVDPSSWRSCQVVARAFAFIWSNSAWVIVPASRSCLADAI